MSSLSLHVSMSLLMDLQWVSSRSTSSPCTSAGWFKRLELKSWKGHPLPAGAVDKIAACGFSTCSCYLYKLWSLYIGSVLSRVLDEICILLLISHLTSILHGHRPPRLKRWEFRSHPSARGVPSSLLYYKENHGIRKYQYLKDFKNRLFKWSFMQ